MLKDVYDSKRINHHLYSDPTSNLSPNNLNNELEFPVKAIIVSNQFWPNFKDNFNVELPPNIQKHLDNYTKAFESFKVAYKFCYIVYKTTRHESYKCMHLHNFKFILNFYRVIGL